MRFLMIALLALAAPAFPQGLNLVMPSAFTPPGSSATVNVMLTNSTVAGAPGLSALQFSFTAPPEIGQMVIAAGPAATAAGKSISCSPAVPTATGASGICILWGLNVTTIGDGVVAIMTAPVLATAKAATETLGILLSLASDANGTAVSVASMGGAFQVFSFCDLDRSGAIDMVDVTAVVGQVIGLSACTTGDLTKDGKCTVLDVYREVIAALPTSSGVANAGVCKVGP
jgi:hypothetical protein